MYWQKRFDRENPDADLEKLILEIRNEHKDFGYRRIHAELNKKGLIINKKKVQRLIQKIKYTSKIIYKKKQKILFL